MKPFIRILHLEDDPKDVELVQANLKEAGLTCRITVVQDRDEFEKALRQDEYDIILADFRLPMYDGMSAMRLVQELHPEVPFVFVSGAMGEEAAIEAMKLGATDYVLKQKMLRLASAVERALHEAENRRERERAQRALQESEAKMRSILENIGIGVALISPKMEILELNRRMREWFPAIDPGQRPICYRSFRDPPREEVCDYCPTYKTLLDGLVNEATTQLQQAGVIRDYRIVSSPLLNKSGEVTASIIMVEDITERKRVEDALRNSEREKTILNQIANIFLTFPDEAMYGEVLAVIRQVMKSKFGTFGYIGENGDLIIPSLTREIWNECRVSEKSIVFPSDSWGNSLWGRAIREKKTFYKVGPFRTPEGHIHIDNFLCMPIVYGQKTIGQISVANKEGGYTEEDKDLLERMVQNISPILHARLQKDIEERMRLAAENDLRKSEEKYRSMMESISDPLYICSPDYRVEYMNRAMIQRTGYDAKGEYCYRAIHGYNDKCPGCLHERIFQGNPFENEVFSPRDSRIYHVINSPIFKSDGSISKLTIFRDITDQKRAEEEREKLQIQLRQAQKMEAIGTLAGGISHDFNNILTAIIGYSELVLDDLPEGSIEKQNLGKVLKAGIRAKDLVQQILAFSRQTEQERRPLDIGAIAKEVLKLLRSTLPTTIRIEQNISPSKHAILADPTQIHQVLMNLCTNSADAMHHQEGILSVKLSDVNLGSREVAAIPGLIPGLYKKMSVTDTGDGIEPAVLDKIFDPYFTTKKTGEGTGLGLAVVHGIVKSHKGSIQVNSKPGHGTTFDVYFPVTTMFEEDEFHYKTPMPRGTERILLVDDEETVVEMYGELLKRLGYQVVVTINSLHALDLFKAEPQNFDLVITDQTMPDKTGFELAQDIIRIRQDVPIILCTGFSKSVDAQQAKAAGIREFALKPIIPRQLAEIVRRILDDSENSKATSGV